MTSMEIAIKDGVVTAAVVTTIQGTGNITWEGFNRNLPRQGINIDIVLHE